MLQWKTVAIRYYQRSLASLTLCMPNTHICVWVWSKKEQEKKTFHSWDRTRDYRIGRLVSYPLGHQGSWVFHERLCSYSFVNYDTEIKHSACKGLMTVWAIWYISFTDSKFSGFHLIGLWLIGLLGNRLAVKP